MAGIVSRQQIKQVAGYESVHMPDNALKLLAYHRPTLPNNEQILKKDYYVHKKQLNMARKCQGFRTEDKPMPPKCECVTENYYSYFSYNIML